jgi:hypothetical protein
MLSNDNERVGAFLRRVRERWGPEVSDKVAAQVKVAEVFVPEFVLKHVLEEMKHPAVEALNSSLDIKFST